MSQVNEVVYRGSKLEFIVFVDSLSSLKKYREGADVAVSEILSNQHVYISSTGQGAQGDLGIASKELLAEEFGTNLSTQDAIKKILLKGRVQEKQGGRGEVRKDHPQHTSHGKVVL